MLAVALSPHGSRTAPLARGYIVPGALDSSLGSALEAELQVRASFQESLQLHMQLRVAQKSSRPSAETGSTGAVGSAMMRREARRGRGGQTELGRKPRASFPTGSPANRLERLTEPSRHPRPGLDQGSEPFRKDLARAGWHLAAEFGDRTRKRTWRPPHGRSATTRRSRLWRWRDGLLTERTSCNQGSGGPKNGESHGIMFDSFHNESLPKGEHQRHIHERAPFHATRCDVEGEYSREPSAHQAGT
jgi:hypothetical protein